MPNPARLGLLFLLPSNRLSVKIDQISSYSYSDLFFFLFFFPLSNPLTNLQAIPACVIVVEIQTSSSFPLPDGLRLTPNTPKSSTPHSPPLLFFFFPSPSSTLSLPLSLPSSPSPSPSGSLYISPIRTPSFTGTSVVDTRVPQRNLLNFDGHFTTTPTAPSISGLTSSSLT
jgi:hypothetical protein